MIKGGYNPYSKTFSKRYIKSFKYKTKKRNKFRKGKGKKVVKSYKKRQFSRRKTSKK